jgi:8-oxo-dGTP diphosphatase
MEENPTWLAVVAVALIDSRGLVLMQRRRLVSNHGGLWEFPGGKVEAGETAEQAAVREIAEELDLAIDAEALDPIGFAVAPPAADHERGGHERSGQARIVLVLYRCRAWRGEPACLDAEEIGWFELDALAGLAMPPLDYPLAQALKKAI